MVVGCGFRNTAFGRSGSTVGSSALSRLAEERHDWLILRYETAKMRCFFIFDDRRNTRWHKADIRKGRNGSVSRKPNGAYRKCTARLRGLPIRAPELRSKVLLKRAPMRLGTTHRSYLKCLRKLPR